MMHKLTDAVPVEKEEEVLTDHEYDGIRELDNNLPPWWTTLFYATIAFSVVYLVYYHVLDMGPLQEEEYQIQMANAEAALEEFRAEKAEEGELIDEENVNIVTDESTLAEAGRIYMQYCSACHGNEGQGGVGPNLTDNYWIHGGSVQDIFNTIKYGVPEKGMIAWQGQLSPEQMQGLSSYILESLVGTNPPNPKESQGELYESQGEEMSMN
jgi:cytochrome c oxidase cbb3-type subunit 3